MRRFLRPLLFFWAGAVGLMPKSAAGESASLVGTTGLLNVPAASITRDGEFHLGYNLIDRDQSYEGRGTLDNRIYFLTLGFLPRTEVSIRATVLPGQSHIEGLKVDAVDRMGCVRFLILDEKKTEGTPELISFPSLAIGIDDIKGTRRYHSFYVVATKSVIAERSFVHGQVTAGYGFRTFRAARYLLDGEFCGADICLGKWASFIVEYDSEKWNGGLRVLPAFPLTAQLALLNFETPSGGLSWTHRF